MSGLLADMIGHYDRHVPRDIRANILYRRKVRQRCEESERFRNIVTTACARDPLYWINTFVWTYNPRKTPSTIPFITWTFQDKALTEMFDAFGRQDAGIEKSRDVGASWMCLLPIDHHFIFGGKADYLILSYKADLVDGANDWSAIMPKLDIIHDRLPGWMQPRVRRTNMRIVNTETGSVIRGETTQGNAGRGGRFKVVFLDEFAAVDPGDQDAILAATADTTECRLFNSTPNGAGNAYYDLIHRDTTRKIRIHWSEHPEKGAGLYHGTSPSNLLIVDRSPTEWTDYSDPAKPVKRAFPDDYPFILDGKKRSIWYDRECVRRANNEQEISKELDINYHASDYTFFPGELIDRCIRQHAVDAVAHGMIDYDPYSGDFHRWVPTPKGFGSIWVHLDGQGKPPPARYAAAADIAMGTGATPSTIVVGNTLTGEKVAQFLSGEYSPERWAVLFVAVCRWFANEDGRPAQAIWEANGPGRVFGKKVMELGGIDAYYRDRKEADHATDKTNFAGWWNNEESATLLFNEYRAALVEGRYINRSREALDETRLYVMKIGGGSAPVHSGSTRKNDPTSARDNHGDLVVADALFVRRMGDRPERAAPNKYNPPPNSIAGRLALLKQGEVRAFDDDPRWAVGG